jgi:radical SAM protein with 4Fe4S-binding SPASM domain
MSLVLFVRLARKLREAGIDQLGLFHIGEPMLCEWLPQAIDYAKRECGYPYVFLTTNGLKATPARVRECMLAGLDSLKFSLNFSGRTQLQALAGGLTEDLDVLVGNVQEARRIRDELAATTGRRCALYGSSLLYDERQRERMRKLLERLLPSLDEHYWLPLYGHCGLPRARCDTPAGIDAAPPRKPVPCWSLFTQAHVTVDGKLSACALDASPRFHMGDLTTTPLRDAWESARFQALRSAHLRDDVRGTVCEDCIGYET